MYRLSVCPPDLNKGWDTSWANTSGIVLGDCSVLYADTMNGGYTTKCMVYCLAKIILFFVTVQYIWVLRGRRIATKRKAMNLMEKLSYINLTISFLHGVVCIDINGSSGIFNYYFTSFIKGACAGLMIGVASNLITSWVSVIDGGKTKQTPLWCDRLNKFTMFFGVFSECGLGMLEVFVGQSTSNGYRAAFDGNVNAVKNLSFAGNLFVWVVVSVR
jgi:hypothetical protein